MPFGRKSSTPIGVEVPVNFVKRVEARYMAPSVPSRNLSHGPPGTKLPPLKSAQAAKASVSLKRSASTSVSADTEAEHEQQGSPKRAKAEAHVQADQAVPQEVSEAQQHEADKQQALAGHSGHVKRCAECDTTETSTWRRGADGKLICNKCGLRKRKDHRAPSRRLKTKEELAEAGEHDMAQASCVRYEPKALPPRSKSNQSHVAQLSRQETKQASIKTARSSKSSTEDLTRVATSIDPAYAPGEISDTPVQPVSPPKLATPVVLTPFADPRPPRPWITERAHLQPKEESSSLMEAPSPVSAKSTIPDAANAALADHPTPRQSTKKTLASTPGVKKLTPSRLPGPKRAINPITLEPKICVMCGTDQSPAWRKDAQHNPVCNKCMLRHKRAEEKLAQRRQHETPQSDAARLAEAQSTAMLTSLALKSGRPSTAGTSGAPHVPHFGHVSVTGGDEAARRTDSQVAIEAFTHINSSRAASFVVDAGGSTNQLPDLPGAAGFSTGKRPISYDGSNLHPDLRPAFLGNATHDTRVTFPGETKQNLAPDSASCDRPETGHVLHVASSQRTRRDSDASERLPHGRSLSLSPSTSDEAGAVSRNAAPEPTAIPTWSRSAASDSMHAPSASDTAGTGMSASTRDTTEAIGGAMHASAAGASVQASTLPCTRCGSYTSPPWYAGEKLRICWHCGPGMVTSKV